MIFVVLGTQKFQLNRLLKEIDELIEKGGITQEVIAQIGSSDYEPKHFKFYRFIDKQLFDELIEKSTVVISHSGVGSIITALKAKKPIIVFPRMQKYHEHVDDHQLDIAKAFEKMNYIVCCHEDETLSQTMKRCRHYPFAVYVSNTNKITDIIIEFLGNYNTAYAKRFIDEYAHQISK